VIPANDGRPGHGGETRPAHIRPDVVDATPTVVEATDKTAARDPAPCRSETAARTALEVLAELAELAAGDVVCPACAWPLGAHGVGGGR
jgi:hypothetical protein